MDKIEQLIENQTLVVSFEHGVCKIIKLFNMYDGIYDYIEIIRLKDSTTHLLCVNEGGFRELSSRPCIEIVLMWIQKKINDPLINEACILEEKEFISLSKDMKAVANTIVSLFRKEKRSQLEEQILDSNIKSLTQEIAQVYKTDSKEAKCIVDTCMKTA